MEKLVSLNSVALPLPMDNIDTDQIMPKQFLRGIDKSGLAQGTFYNLRCNADGSKKPECVFNKPGFENAGIIVAGPNFGCGSSREHAVWGLMQIGIRVVVSTGFGEIFYSNCFNNGLLAAKVSAEDLQEILDSISADTPVELSIDVENCEIRNGDRGWKFSVGERHRNMIMQGLDMVDATLADIELIKAFRDEHEKKFPWMAKLAAKAKIALERAV